MEFGDYCIISRKSAIGIDTVVMNYVEIRDGVCIGDRCYIDSGACFTGDSIIGDDVTIRNYCVIARGSEIGDRTFLSPRVMFNNLDSEGEKIGGAKIGSDCFIGTNTVLHHGITICDGVTVGAMSLVNKDITEPGVYAGVPARRIK